MPLKPRASADIESRISELIAPQVRASRPYAVANAAGLIKLDAMENPYAWPSALREDWVSELGKAALNRYPDPTAGALKQHLRETLQVPPNQAILLGNGSDEIIQLILLAVQATGRPILAPEPTFVMYGLIARWLGLPYTSVPLDARFGLDMVRLRRAVVETRPAVVFLAYPNNPTGNRWPRAQLEALIALAPGLVVMDEAYAPFADDSFLADVGRYDHVLVMRTLSKMGLAGLRLGYLVGKPQWLEELDKLRLPYNINVLTQVSATFALRHKALFDEQALRIRADRAWLEQALNALPGIQAFPSEANFILFRTPPGRATDIFTALKARGILIKNLSAPGLLADCLRVTVGTPDENRVFIEVLTGSLAA